MFQPEKGVTAQLAGQASAVTRWVRHRQRARRTVFPAKEPVKKLANRLNPGRSVVPAKAGAHAKVLFQRLKWIPAFAGMTLVHQRTGNRLARLLPLLLYYLLSR